MAKLVIIGVIVFCVVVLIVYITELIRNHNVKSSWQVIKYTGNSVEPKDIYICRRCNNKEDINYCYCPNCGASMKNGEPRIYYSSEIDLSE